MARYHLAQINDLHERAMSLAEAAIVARTGGDEAASRQQCLAEKLLAVGLAGDPPAGIADEMRDLMEQVYSHRELLVC